MRCAGCIGCSQPPLLPPGPCRSDSWEQGCWIRGNQWEVRLKRLHFGSSTYCRACVTNRARLCWKYSGSIFFKSHELSCLCVFVPRFCEQNCAVLMQDFVQFPYWLDISSALGVNLSAYFSIRLNLPVSGLDPLWEQAGIRTDIAGYSDMHRKAVQYTLQCEVERCKPNRPYLQPHPISTSFPILPAQFWRMHCTMNQPLKMGWSYHSSFVCL